MQESLRYKSGNGPVVSDKYVRWVNENVVTQKDFQTTPELGFCPLLVTGNDERNILTVPRLRCFAKFENKPIFRWRKKVSFKKGSKPVSQRLLHEVFENYEEAMFQYFCEGAPAHMVDNYSPEKVPN